MFKAIRKVREVPSLADLPELGEAKARRPVQVEIPRAPRAPVGRVEDKLEKAAVQSPVGTLPERIVWKWLLDHDYQFEYQLAELGGRDVVGGSVIDFVVYGVGLKRIVIRVMGTYWHGPKFPERQARDDEQFIRLHALGYAVCDLWEHDIYDAVENDRLTPYMEDNLFDAE